MILADGLEGLVNRPTGVREMRLALDTKKLRDNSITSRLTSDVVFDLSTFSKRCRLVNL